MSVIPFFAFLLNEDPTEKLNCWQISGWVGHYSFPKWLFFLFLHVFCAFQFSCLPSLDVLN